MEEEKKRIHLEMVRQRHDRVGKGMWQVETLIREQKKHGRTRSLGRVCGRWKGTRKGTVDTMSLGRVCGRWKSNSQWPWANRVGSVGLRKVSKLVAEMRSLDIRIKEVELDEGKLERGCILQRCHDRWIQDEQFPNVVDMNNRR